MPSPKGLPLCTSHLICDNSNVHSTLIKNELPAQEVSTVENLRKWTNVPDSVGPATVNSKLATCKGG